MNHSEGTTPTERYLSKLCRKSFLSLWSYPNLYKDQGLKGENGTGKEICDLTVIFGNDVIIFSDKYIEFQRNVDISVAWKRWYREAIAKSAAQIYKAEHWFRGFPGRIFLDPHCKKPIPIPFPDPNSIRVHRVAVALGVYDACKEHFGGNSIGSFCIHSDIVGEAHLDTPFTIGHINPKKGFVHVFEDFTLDAVMSEVDTIADFVAYLTKKENLLTQETPIIFSPGEEQLLAIYLTRLNDAGEHDFSIINDDADFIMLEEVFWDSLMQNPRYHAKKKADEISYTWDRLIEHFITVGSSHVVSGAALSTKEMEKALHLTVSEPRLRRRELADALINLMEKPFLQDYGVRLVYTSIFPNFPNTAYLFLAFKYSNDISYDEYRSRRRRLLLAYCRVAKLRAPNAINIIGIATEPINGNGGSEDLVVLDVNDWTPAMQEEAESLQKDFSLLLDENIRMTPRNIKEYPDVRKMQKAQPQSKNLNRKQRRTLAAKKRKR